MGSRSSSNSGCGSLSVKPSKISKHGGVSDEDNHAYFGAAASPPGVMMAGQIMAAYTAELELIGLYTK